jgi:hypothetical protein
MCTLYVQHLTVQCQITLHVYPHIYILPVYSNARPNRAVFWSFPEKYQGYLNTCLTPFQLTWPKRGHVSYCHHWAPVVCRPSVRPLTFHILINSSEATVPIWTKLWWNGPWMAPFQNYVRWSRLPTKMATKLKIEKRGDEILIVHCCFSISQIELKF